MPQIVSRSDIHAEMDRARVEFRVLLQRSTPAVLAAPSDGTRWTNEQLLFHMLFGYLIVRNLLVIAKIVTRLPASTRSGFARMLNMAAGPFHHINYWGSCAGAWIVPAARMGGKFDWVVASLHRRLDGESDSELQRWMPFPTRWDPFFTDRMTVADLYHYATKHFDFHQQQLAMPRP
jgi:DinB superfamily